MLQTQDRFKKIKLMKIIVKENPVELGEASGQMAAQIIRRVIKKTGQANIILATGTSQFETLNHLTKEEIASFLRPQGGPRGRRD